MRRTRKRWYYQPWNDTDTDTDGPEVGPFFTRRGALRQAHRDCKHAVVYSTRSNADETEVAF